MTVRILIADDHAVVRQGLRMFLGLDPELDVVGEAANGEEAVRQARALHPDVVLMDLLMPVLDGIGAITTIRRELPDVEVIALTSVLEDDKVVGAIKAGAIGYLLKDTDADELRRAIRPQQRGRCNSHRRLPHDCCAKCAEKLRWFLATSRSSTISPRY
jgi:DNA-binding NarL/FixJ family response regulator